MSKISNKEFRSKFSDFSCFKFKALLTILVGLENEKSLFSSGKVKSRVYFIFSVKLSWQVNLGTYAEEP